MNRIIRTTSWIGLFASLAGCATFAPAPPVSRTVPGTHQAKRFPNPSSEYRTRNDRSSRTTPRTAKKPSKPKELTDQPLPRHFPQGASVKPAPVEKHPLTQRPAPVQAPTQLGPDIIPQEIVVPAKLELEVQAASRKQVGSGVTYHLIVRNTGDEKADDVVVECDFDDALVFPGQREKKARQSLGRIVAGETKEIDLTLVSDQVGKHVCRFTITSADVESVWKAVTVEFLPKRLDVQIVGSSRRTLDSRAEMTIKLTNTSDEPIDGLHVAATYDTTLKPKEATAGASRDGNNLTWSLGMLQAGEGVQLQIEFECPALSHHSCLLVHVTGDDIPDEEAEVCLEIVPIEGTLDLQVEDMSDLMQVNEETEYRVSVMNRGLQTARDIRLTAEVPVNFRVLAVQVFRGAEQLNTSFEVRGRQIVFDSVPALSADAQLQYVIQAKALGAGDGEFRAELIHAARQKPTEVTEMTTVNP